MIKFELIKKKLTIFGIVIVSSVLMGIFIFLFSGIYSVNKITILGQTDLQKDKILKLANIDMKKNIYMIDTKKVQKNLEKDSYIESASVRRRFPREITISVVERIPVGSVPVTGGYVVIDENALAISIIQDESLIKKPVIGGLQVKDIKLGDTIPVNNKGDLENILKIIRLISSLNLLNNISYIDLKNYNDIAMTTNTGILVRFGSTENMEYKTKLLNKILIDLSTKGKMSGTIDMRFDTDPVFYQE